jgi:hypothetical protein
MAKPEEPENKPLEKPEEPENKPLDLPYHIENELTRWRQGTHALVCDMHSDKSATTLASYPSISAQGRALTGGIFLCDKHVITC